MKINILPKSKLGKWATGLGIAFILMILLKIKSFMPLPTFAIAAIGLAGFICGIMAIIKKERALAIFIPILVGLIITLWIAAEIIYPH